MGPKPSLVLSGFLLLALAGPAAAGWGDEVGAGLSKKGEQMKKEGKENKDPVEFIVGAILEKAGDRLQDRDDDDKDDRHEGSGESGGDEQPRQQSESSGGGDEDDEREEGGEPPREPSAQSPQPGDQTAQRDPPPPPPSELEAPSGSQRPPPPPPPPESDSTLLVKRGPADEPAPPPTDGPLALGDYAPRKELRSSSLYGGLARVATVKGRAVSQSRAHSASAAETVATDPPPQLAAIIPAMRALERVGGSSPSKAVVPTVGGDARGPEEQAQRLVREAQSQLRIADSAGALATVERAIEADPDNADAYARKAEALNQLRRWPEAEQAALKSVELDSGNAVAWQAAAFSQLRQKKFDKALLAIDAAIRMNPSDGSNFLIRGQVKEAMGDRRGALADYERAAFIDKRFRDAYERAREGEKLYDPEDDSTTLGDLALRARRRGLPVFTLGALALLLLGAAGGFLLRRSPAKAQAPAGLPVPNLQSLPGRLAGKYELQSVIGRGGMGVVHQAVDHTLGRTVAVKQMSAALAELGPKSREMLIKEAKTVAQLHHPAIVDIYEILELGPDLYLVFELVTGKTALQLLAEQGRMPLPRLLELLRPVCQALEFAHGRGMVHRDLKPSNIMLTENGVVKLMDFGIARSLADASPVAGPDAVERKTGPFARTQTVLGTPQYMPPEMETGIVSKEGDVYALGVCLYELATGRLPFQTLMQKALLDFPAPSQLVPELGDSIDALVRAALQPKPENRLKSPAQFLELLEQAARASTTPPGAEALPRS